MSALRRNKYLTPDEILELLNRDDSDLSSLSEDDDDDYDENDNRVFSNDDDDEDQDQTFNFSAPSHWGMNTDKFDRVSFDFQELGCFDYQSTKPIEYFLEYLDEDFFKEMAMFTNIRSVAQTGKSLNVSQEEMMTFIGCSALLSCYGYPRIKMIWERFTRIPVIADNISRDRFFQLRSNLKVVDDNDVPKEVKEQDKFWKVRPMLNKIRERCLKHKRPKIVSIDEQIIPFHGQVSMRQYVRGKPNPVGLKVFVMCSSYGLPLDFIIYEGKGTDVESPEDTSFLDLGGKVVLKLSDSLSPGSSIYVDRYFTSELLLDYLLNRELYATGTLMKNKVPKFTQLKSDLVMKREGRGSIDQVVRGDKKMCLVKWFDNKGVLLLSNEHGKSPITKCSRWSKKDKAYLEVDCPNIVRSYNEYMGGVDHLDRCISYYRMKHRTNKWTVRVILHMIDFVMSSAWLSYRNKMIEKCERKKDILDYFRFRLNIATTLIFGLVKKPGAGISSPSPTLSNDEDDEPPRKRRVMTCIPHEAARSKEARHMPEIIGDRSHRSRCRNVKCSALTTVHCTDCKVFLCFTSSRNCFKLFHESKK